MSKLHTLLSLRPLCLSLAVVVSTGGAAPGAVRLPTLLSDHMVLQQDKPVRVWGWADAGEQISVSIAGQKVIGEANGQGRWSLFLDPMNAGGPHEMIVEAGNTLRVHDVLIGEVWVGSGQSNMVWPLGRSNNAEREVAEADYPKIRFFKVASNVSDFPLDDAGGKWVLATPENAPSFSAVAYFFARRLHKELGAPFGIIQSAWGGTPAQSWTSHSALANDPALRPVFDAWATILADYPAKQLEYEKQLAKWEAAKGSGAATGRGPRSPLGPGHPHSPSGLYNAMIAPLTPFAIRGVIWYQGETDAGRAGGRLYRRLFPALIQDWRRAWGQGAFPFLFVQLANYAKVSETAQWPQLREAQMMTLGLRSTGMAVTTDIGESNDIHPRNKQDVGARLALAARAVAYGHDIVSSGPIYRQVTAERGALRVWFEHLGGGLKSGGGGALSGFTISGSDRTFVAAQARMDGDTVVVSSSNVAEPAALRYNWENDPAGNLNNRSDLPASAFRTDDWRNAKMPK